MFESEELFSNAINIYNTATSHADALHKFHTEYEQPIFNLLRSKYLDKLKRWWQTYILPLPSDKSIVIYETRCHPNLEFLIYNLTYFARGWGLTIFCSDANYTFIKTILGNNSKNADLQVVRKDEGGKEVRDEYNKFTKSIEFWNLFRCSHVLMSEMDSYLRRPIPDTAINYDYICCYWPWHSSLSGGGGISIRNVNAMKSICNTYPTLTDEYFGQDNWAAEGVNRLHLSYNNSLLIEANHGIIDPIGFHNWWTFINPSELYRYYHIYDNYLRLEIDKNITI